MRAIIEVDVPDYQIGQEASIYFKDTMMIKGVVQEPSETIHGSTYGGVSWGGTYKPQEPSIEIVKTEESNDNNTKYLNINVSNSEVERNPDIVRLSADVGILEYVRSSGDLISRQMVKDKHKERLVNSLKDDDRGIDLSKYAEEPCKAFCEFMDSIPPVNPKEPRAGYPQKSCDTCKHSDETDGSHCYECVKDMRNNYSPKKIKTKMDFLESERRNKMTTYQLYLAVLGALTDEVAKTYLLELYKRVESQESEDN